MKSRRALRSTKDKETPPKPPNNSILNADDDEDEGNQSFDFSPGRGLPPGDGIPVLLKDINLRVLYRKFSY